MPYVIAFENLPAATAAAQTVVVTDQLDTQVFDLDSFTLGPILIGNIGITPPPGLATFSGGADLRPAHNVVLRVDAGLDKTTGIVTWRFTSLDPSTMETLTDPDEGFLPPNTNPPAGDAQVHFTIRPKAGLATGTAIRNHARVVFDTNAPIDTPEWLNTIDASAPSTTPTPSPTPTPPACAGDCNQDGSVTVDELIKGVNIALGTMSVAACSSFDTNGDGAVTINELIAAVNRALNGCADTATNS